MAIGERTASDFLNIMGLLAPLFLLESIARLSALKDLGGENMDNAGERALALRGEPRDSNGSSNDDCGDQKPQVRGR